MFKAIGKNVIAKAVMPVKESKIILTATEDKPTHYEVISVGSDVKEVYIGDKLPYPQYAQQTFKDDEEVFHVFSMDNIYAKKI